MYSTAGGCTQLLAVVHYNQATATLRHIVVTEEIQWLLNLVTLDLVTLDLVTILDLVTLLPLTSFLLSKKSRFSDKLANFRVLI